MQSLEPGPASAGQRAPGVACEMGQMDTDTHYCILQTLAMECELGKARRPLPQLLPLHNSSRKTVYFSEKPIASLPAERPR